MSEELLAAVDLGSNSFRLLIGKLDGNQIVPVSTLREGVRLAGGLTEHATVSDAKIEEACAALGRFRERLSAVSPKRIRAVATSTYRVAKNAAQLLKASEAALGIPIDVISGTEEARLIYIGCAHSLPWSEDDRLIVDIGGGSTEFVIGRGYEPSAMESFLLGAVTLSQNFFPDGMVTAASFRKADVYVRSRLEVMQPQYKRGWEIAYGSSGTVRALFEIITENDFGKAITQDSLVALRDHLVEVGRMDRVELNALKAARAPVLPGGLAILLGLVRELSVAKLEPADGALRLGALYDLLARKRSHGNNGSGENKNDGRATDTRGRTIDRMQRRYDIDAAQSQRVSAISQALWASLGHETPDEILDWAASLHEIGMAIAHEDYHRHSAYVIEHSDLPGFSERERTAVAQLVLGHTGSLKKLVRDELSNGMLQRLLCVRIAAIFAHGRTDSNQTSHVRIRGSGFELLVDRKLNDTLPLTSWLLDEECERWNKWGVSLNIAH
jgi:exopolyphosphatase / guanosine-5'-triphosphate,3'-diphosphate pyrophosphatase